MTNGYEDNNFPEEDLTITVNTTDGGTIDCTVLTVFESQGRDYIALLPHDDSNQIHLFRYKAVMDNGIESIEITSINSDMEFDAANEVFQSLIVDDDALVD